MAQGTRLPWFVLSLSEELLLLALDDQRGTVSMNAATTLDTGLAGAQLLDLALAKPLVIQDKLIIAVDGPALDDESSTLPWNSSC